EMPTALITGANGFCGLHLARRLRRESGVEIIGLDVQFEAVNQPLFDMHYTCNVCSSELLRTVAERHKPQWVFHHAGLSGGPPPALYESNVLGAVSLLECVKYVVPQAACLLVGSAAEYGAVAPADVPVKEEQACRPRGPYGISKHAMVLAGLD